MAVVARRRVRRSLALGISALLFAAAALVPQGAGETSRQATTGARSHVLAATPISVQSVSSAETEFVRLLNNARTSNGLKALAVNSDIAKTSRTWSTSIKKAGAISHDPNLVSIITRVLPSWTRAGENVGVGYEVLNLHQAFWNSPGHRANMLGNFNQVGVGVVYSSDGRLWVTFRFALGTLPAPTTTTATVASVADLPDRVGIRRSNAYYLRSSPTSGPADLTYGYGTATDTAVMGDWNGDGIATPGVFRNGTWYLRNSNSSGAANVAFGYGRTGDIPLVGDWDGNGTDTVGVRRGSTFLLRNANGGGGAHTSLNYGWSSDTPIIGDWDGNGTDTVGVRRGKAFYLRNANTSGAANISFSYGIASDTVVVGGW